METDSIKKGEKMDKITVVQVVAIIGGIVGLLKAIEYLCNFFKGGFTKALTPVMDKLDAMDKKIEAVDMNATKNYLTIALADAWKEDLPSVERERIHEEYEHYSKNGGNSYIHTEYERLKEEGKI